MGNPELTFFLAFLPPSRTSNLCSQGSINNYTLLSLLLRKPIRCQSALLIHLFCRISAFPWSPGTLADHADRNIMQTTAEADFRVDFGSFPLRPSPLTLHSSPSSLSSRSLTLAPRLGADVLGRSDQPHADRLLFARIQTEDRAGIKTESTSLTLPMQSVQSTSMERASPATRHPYKSLEGVSGDVVVRDLELGVDIAFVAAV